MSGKPLHHIHFIYSTIHIYPWQIDPTPFTNPPYISGKPLHQICFIYSTMHIYPWEIEPIPQSIEHRCFEYCYTKLGRSTSRCTPQSSMDALNTATPNLADLPPSQSSIDALNTATPNLPELVRSTPHQLKLDARNNATPDLEDLLADLNIYSKMHIYLWQIDTPSSNQA